MASNPVEPVEPAGLQAPVGLFLTGLSPVFELKIPQTPVDGAGPGTQSNYSSVGVSVEDVPLWDVLPPSTPRPAGL